MTVPSVDITRLDNQTGVVKPSAAGVLAIIAPCEKGTANVANSFARTSDVFATYGTGPLSELASYVMNVAKKPVICIRSSGSTAASYSAITSSGSGGTSVATAGGTAPFDSYNVLVEFVTGGTILAAGITYRTSLDGGKTKSKITALGVSNSILIPQSNVTIALAAGTIIAGRTLTFTTTQEQANNADLIPAYEALRIQATTWDSVIVEANADASIITGLDSWLASIETSGKYRHGFVCTRKKASGESDATFKTAMQVIRDAVTSIRVVVSTDGGLETSPARGLQLFRPASWAVAARAMAIGIEVEPAYVSLGPLPAFNLLDASNNPTLGRDEALYPGLDDQKFTCLRSFSDRTGVFVANTYLFSPENSDYVYLPQGRVMARALEICFGVLTAQLSLGVDKNQKAEPSGAVYILEQDAAKIEALVQVAVQNELGQRVSGVRFTLSRTDDLGSNGPGTLSGTLALQAKTYVKKFAITSSFVREISA